MEALQSSEVIWGQLLPNLSTGIIIIIVLFVLILFKLP